MDVKDINYNPTCPTSQQPIKINEEYAITKFGMNYNNLLPMDKFYVASTNETWLYENPKPHPLQLTMLV